MNHVKTMPVPEPAVTRRRAHPARRGDWQGYLYILPALGFYLLFTFTPIIWNLVISLRAGGGPAEQSITFSLQHYQSIFEDAIFRRALWNNILWLVMHVGFAGGFGLAIAVFISRVQVLQRFIRTAFFLPHVVSLAVVGVIWSMVYDPFYGLLNNLLKNIGLSGLAANWLGDTSLVLPSINIASSWQAYGLYMLLFLAGLQTIDRQLYDAAEVDGANAWQQFFHITIPGLREIMVLVISLAVINSFKGFATVWVMTQGGPFYSSELLATYIYKLAFRFQDDGKAAALSMVLGLLAITSTLLYNKWRERVSR